mgnify:CR=1 FL=1|jgi:hypothetical protein
MSLITGICLIIAIWLAGMIGIELSKAENGLKILILIMLLAATSTVAISSLLTT